MNQDRYKKINEHLDVLISEGRLSKEILSNPNDIRLREHTLYRRLDITGASSTFKLIQQGTDYEEGIVNIHGRKFDAGNAFIFDKISVGYSNGASGDSPATKEYRTSFPAILRNADIIVHQNTREVLRKPLSDYIVYGIPTSPREMQLDLAALCYLRDNQIFELMIEFPESQTLTAGTTAATAHHFFELKLYGLETTAKL